MNYEFKSAFKQELEDFANIRLNSGYSQSTIAYYIQFDKFLIQSACTDKCIDKALMDQWATQRSTENKNTRNNRVTTIKQFVLYLDAIGFEVYIPNYRFSTSKSVPYVLSKDELILFFRTLDETYSHYTFARSPHYRYMIPVILRLIYSCGLRNNEACQLKTNDICYETKTLIIREAKNNKERLVYLSDDMFQLLLKYMTVKDRFISSSWIFPSLNSEKHILKTSIDQFFHKIVVKASIGSSEHYPTPHSLRHSYVVHRIDGWLKDGHDVDTLIPYLSKQLGHSTIEDTYYYYHMLNSSYESIRKKDRNLFPEVTLCEEE